MPSCALPDTRLPSGGTTKTGGSSPCPRWVVLRAGSWSMNSVPPISFPLDARSADALPPLPIADSPGRDRSRCGWRPPCCSTTRELMPFPPFPEITLATAPDAAVRIGADVVARGGRRHQHAITRVAGNRSGQVQSNVVAVQRDRPCVEFDTAARCVADRQAQELRPLRARGEHQPRMSVGIKFDDWDWPAPWVGAEVPSMMTSRVTAGRSLASVIVPFKTDGRIAERIGIGRRDGGRSRPHLKSFRLLTTNVDTAFSSPR